MITTKVDPDAVFFPDRARAHLAPLKGQTYIYIYIYICIYTHTHTYIKVYIYIYTHMYM